MWNPIHPGRMVPSAAVHGCGKELPLASPGAILQMVRALSMVRFLPIPDGEGVAMLDRPLRRALLCAAAAALVFAVACSSSPGPLALPLDTVLPPDSELATPTPTPSSDSQLVDPTPTDPRTTRTPLSADSEEYDPVLPMSKIFQGISSTLFKDYTPNENLAVEGLKEARAAGDKSMVPVIVTLMRYTNSQWAFDESIVTIRELTGQDFGPTVTAWPAWFEWVGENLDDYRPPDGYAQLKRRFFANIHPGFEVFLEGYEENSRIEPFEIEWGGVSPDGIPPLENPPYIPADQADYLADHERVFGVSIDGEHRAYPLRIMNPHEMANDILGGEPISLAYCTLCGSGIAYSGKFDDIETTFGTSGFLYRSNKLMYDRETLSLWSQETGEPVVGRLADSGIRLEFFPTLLTTWGEWKAEHPDTTVLDLNTNVYQAGRYFPEDNPNATYFDYFNSPDTMFPVWLRDDRLETKDIVLGLKIGDMAKAYPVQSLQMERVVNDTLGDANVVVLASEISPASKVYERGELEFFRADDDTSTGVPMTVIDESGAVWNVTEDALVNASDSSQTLRRIPTHMSFWFGWYAFYPDTLLYGSEG